MLVTTPADFTRALETTRLPPTGAPTMAAALLVDPQAFGFARESAQDNVYMDEGAIVDLERAWTQHQALSRQLLELGVPILRFPGREGQSDGVFPNNVFATIPGRFIVGAMRHGVRQKEANRLDVRSLFLETFGYELHEISRREAVAELTGPLILDRRRRLGFCGLSQRCDQRGAELLHEAFDLALTFRFKLVETEYHTNIVLSVLDGRAAVIHPPSFVDPEVPEAIAWAFPEGATLILSDEEKAAFAGNCLAVTPEDVLFSQTAFDALRPESLSFFETHGFRAHGVEVSEFEKGGGSLRCLIAEIF